MESIIKHLVEMTGHRDHDLLNLSVLTAMREILDAQSARVLELVQVGDAAFVKIKVCLNTQGLSRSDDGLAEVDSVPLDAHFPHLKNGLEQKLNLIEHQDANFKRVLWLPIWVNEKVQTCLEISEPRQFNSNSLEVVSGMLIVYRNFQNLLDYSERDSLTGLLNRKTFEDSFGKIVRSPAQHAVVPPDLPQERRRPDEARDSWLAVLDIDHFKRVNDQFGHLYGDEVLILIANLLRTSFRPCDRLFRFGGEEFVVLLRNVNQADAQLIFDRFRETVETHDFPQVGRVTVSVGYARITNYEPPVEIMGRADQALYHAKTHGRNQTCFYEDLIAEGSLKAGLTNGEVEFF